MPAKEILTELKLQMLFKYIKIIIPTYKKRHCIGRSRWTGIRFFKEYGYSKKQHNTIINTAFIQQNFKNKTDHLIGDCANKASILQCYRERKGPMQ